MDDDFGEDRDFLAALSSNQVLQSTQSSSNPSKSAPPKVQQPKPQALPQRAGPSSILVSPRQKGNPVLNSIRALPWEYADIPADYVLGQTTCALFLSLKYHRLHPEYIYSRIRELAGKYGLRIVLTMVDIQNHEEPLKELSKTSLVNNVTIVLCWSSQEAGRYLELFKSYEHAAPTSIKAHQSTSYSEKLVDFITVPRSINKTDAVGLVSSFGSVRTAVSARPEEVALVDGWGEKKVQRWCNTVREPFRVKKAARRGIDREDSRGVPAPGTTPTNEAEDSQEHFVAARADENAAFRLGIANKAPTQSQRPPADEAQLESTGGQNRSEKEPDEDEEDAFREAHGISPSKPTDDSTAKRRKVDDTGLSRGIAAELERLRQGG